MAEVSLPIFEPRFVQTSDAREKEVFDLLIAGGVVVGGRREAPARPSLPSARL